MVALAAGGVGVVGHTQQAAGGDGVTASLVVPAALDVEAYEVWEGRERCGETGTLEKCLFLLIRCTSGVFASVFVSLLRELTCSRCEADAAV